MLAFQKHRGINQLIPGNPDIYWQSQDLNTGCPTPCQSSRPLFRMLDIGIAVKPQKEIKGSRSTKNENMNSCKHSGSIFLNVYTFSTTLKAEEIIFHLPLLPKCSQQSELGQVKARSPELPHVLPHGWQRPKYPSPHLLPPRLINKKLNWKQIARTWTTHLDMGYSYPSWQLNTLGHHTCPRDILIVRWLKNMLVGLSEY